VPADECEFFCMDYCLPPDYLVKSGFVCSKALPIHEGDITNKCGGNNEELMTEEEWEELQQKAGE
jgi:hypothetical protein